MKQFFLQAFLVLTAVLAYLDTAGLNYFLPEKFAWVPIAIGILNIVLRQIGASKVDKV